MTPEAMARLKAKAEARAAIVNDIARILWENGEMLAGTEGGAMPSWEEIVAGKNDPSADQDRKDACFAWFLGHARGAELLLSLDARDALTLAKHLIDSAMRLQEALEMDLWRKIERAKGFEPGSLTNAPGVRQRVAL